MWGCGVDGHSKDWVTNWYIKAFEQAPGVRRRDKIRKNRFFVGVSLEAAKWVWFLHPKIATEMLNWAVYDCSSFKSDDSLRMVIEMEEQLDKFKKQLSLGATGYYSIDNLFGNNCSFFENMYQKLDTSIVS